MSVSGVGSNALCSYLNRGPCPAELQGSAALWDRKTSDRRVHWACLVVLGREVLVPAGLLSF